MPPQPPRPEKPKAEPMRQKGAFYQNLPLEEVFEGFAGDCVFGSFIVFSGLRIS